MSTGPLDGLVVLDCSDDPAGWRATGLLADYGATVIWVEPPGGAPGRSRHPVECAVFNRGKRSVVIDFQRGGLTHLRRLLTTADVLVEDRVPSWAEAGLAEGRSLLDEFPRLVHCVISGMGPYPADDINAPEPIVHAVLGTMAEQLGHRDGPIFEGIPFASIGAGYLADIGILSALYRRGHDGRGRRINTSLLEGALVYLSMFWGEAEREPVRRSRHAKPGPETTATSTRLVTGSFLCADGEYIGVHTGAVGAFDRLIRALGLDDRILPTGEGAEMGIPLSAKEQRILDTQIHKIFASASRETWVDRLVAGDVCAIPQLYPGEVFDEPQTRHNRMVEQVPDRVHGPMEQVGLPIKFSLTPGAVTGPAPWPGEHTATLRDDDPNPVGHLVTGADAQLPLLDGVRILDLGAYFAGPFASRLLAGLGADVIKVEPLDGDPLRGIGSLFRPAQAGKRSIAVDLRRPGARAVLAELLSWASVVHHNMRPGAAERLGAGYADARGINQEIIYGYAPGWGSTGPLAARQSFEPMMSGYVGAGFEASGRFNPPVYPLGNADPGNGLLGAVATLMALLYRQRTGQGQYFENAQLNATMMHVAHIARAAHGRVVGSERLDSLQHGTGPLERLYETKDGWICISVQDDQLDSLSAVINIEITSDERFYSVEDRATNEYALTELIAGALRGEPSERWLKTFRAANLAAAVPSKYNATTFLRDPRNRSTGLVAQSSHPQLGIVRELTCAVRVSHVQASVHRLAPDLGEHTEEILDSLGFTTTTIARLRVDGAIR